MYSYIDNEDLRIVSIAKSIYVIRECKVILNGVRFSRIFTSQYCYMRKSNATYTWNNSVQAKIDMQNSNVRYQYHIYIYIYHNSPPHLKIQYDKLFSEYLLSIYIYNKKLSFFIYFFS